jgi:S1-C subfamily serine protease
MAGGSNVLTIPGGLRHHRPVVTIPVPVPVGGPTVVVESPPVVVTPPAPPMVEGKTSEVPVAAAGQTPPGANTTAVKITEVVARGPAARAGLQPGDVVLRIDDKRVKTCDALRAAVGRASKVVVTFYNPDDQKLDVREVPVADGKIGIMMEEIPVNLEDEGSTAGPVVAAAATGPTAPQITEVVARSPAARAGLQVGDVIVSVDGKRVSTPTALTAALKSAAEVEVLFVNPDNGKAETRKVKPSNGEIGLSTKAVSVAER